MFKILELAQTCILCSTKRSDTNKQFAKRKLQPVFCTKKEMMQTAVFLNASKESSLYYVYVSIF